DVHPQGLGQRRQRGNGRGRRSDAQGHRPVERPGGDSENAVSYRLAVRVYDRSWSISGNERTRLPLTAKIAFATAGAIGAVPGSPTPPHFLPPVSARCTSVFGACARRTIW